ncbi:PqiC family protein [Paraburkholderia saeva]|uniref:PqiC family protein n=1 Tax=Paraburkholderia saeva TaxID=2777537 RepID=UPI001D847860|nr:PqiC family protein [Paraburkholderia saeva]CAG4895114.1 hypothetical protein R70241_01910 [Paraburkholderia saeva]
MRSARACFILGMAIAGLTAGCASPSATFYTLSPDPSLTRAGTTPHVSVVIGPVTVPDMVDRPQIVTRIGDNEVALNEFARWAQPLKGDIARVIAADLATLLNSQQVSVYDTAYDPLTAWHVRLDVVGFESVPGRDVTVDVLWAVRAPGKARPVTGRSVVREAVSGQGFNPIVAAHDRALASVSRDIAAAVQAGGAQ